MSLPNNGSSPFRSKALAMPRSTTNQTARLNFRLTSDLKQTIEEAAAELGQTVSDFAVSTLVQTARDVLHQRDVTVLSRRDWEIFASLIDNDSAKPNSALVAAARRYKKQVG